MVPSSLQLCYLPWVLTWFSLLQTSSLGCQQTGCHSPRPHILDQQCPEEGLWLLVGIDCKQVLSQSPEHTSSPCPIGSFLNQSTQHLDPNPRVLYWQGHVFILGKWGPSLVLRVGHKNKIWGQVGKFKWIQYPLQAQISNPQSLSTT